MEDHPKRIGNVTAGLMVGCALATDAVIAVFALDPIFIIGLIVNSIITVFAFLSFFVWFKIKGLTLVGLKKNATIIGLRIVGLLPYLGVIPGWTLSTIIVIGWSRLEDKAFNEEQRAQFDQFIKDLKEHQFKEATRKANELRKMKMAEKQQVDNIRKKQLKEEEQKNDELRQIEQTEQIEQIEKQLVDNIKKPAS